MVGSYKLAIDTRVQYLLATNDIASLRLCSTVELNMAHYPGIGIHS
jgi:hypothetical protein